MLKVLDLLERTELNWTVNKEPLTSVDGLKTESFGLFRNDNDNWLGTVGNRYKVYQNFNLAEVIVKASEGVVDAKEIAGGALRGGKKIYLQIPLTDIQVAEDTVKRNITALNSFDGSTSIAFGSSNTVVVCSNTFYMVYKGLQKFRHTTNSESQVMNAAKHLNEAIKLDLGLMDNYKRMVDHKIDKTLFGTIVNKLFDVDLSANKSDVSTKKQNIIAEFNRTMESELDSHGETLWGLFSGVTYFTNHVETKSKNSDEKKEHLMLGGGYRKNFLSYNEIMKFIDSRTTKTISIE